MHHLNAEWDLVGMHMVPLVHGILQPCLCQARVFPLSPPVDDLFTVGWLCMASRQRDGDRLRTQRRGCRRGQCMCYRWCARYEYAESCVFQACCCRVYFPVHHLFTFVPPV